ncbi:hypothetical protein FYJ24_11240 [Actinomycetaceae bacterium WB03_NA08]|uniref:Uncharacterized protein n=1 Tax=Scrofimicrobium canadense TaxID=2652290 RepID=A0A6N7W7T6_9ACTO|nr:hypothetical protein [Scrofimicrobium canadense]MSS85315.1 hypothetical protein [Scrofimicrobium canadense]
MVNRPSADFPFWLMPVVLLGATMGVIRFTTRDYSRVEIVTGLGLAVIIVIFVFWWYLTRWGRLLRALRRKFPHEQSFLTCSTVELARISKRRGWNLEMAQEGGSPVVVVCRGSAVELWTSVRKNAAHATIPLESSMTWKPKECTVYREPRPGFALVGPRGGLELALCPGKYAPSLKKRDLVSESSELIEQLAAQTTSGNTAQRCRESERREGKMAELELVTSDEWHVWSRDGVLPQMENVVLEDLVETDMCESLQDPNCALGAIWTSASAPDTWGGRMSVSIYPGEEEPLPSADELLAAVQGEPEYPGAKVLSSRVWSERIAVGDVIGQRLVVQPEDGDMALVVRATVRPENVNMLYVLDFFSDVMDSIGEFEDSIADVVRNLRQS